MLDLIQEKLKNILKMYTQLGEAVEQISLEDDIREIGINSVTFIKIIVAIEVEFDVEFRDEDMEIENFKTFGDLVNLVNSKMQMK